MCKYFHIKLFLNSEKGAEGVVVSETKKQLNINNIQWAFSKLMAMQGIELAQ